MDSNDDYEDEFYKMYVSELRGLFSDMSKILDEALEDAKLLAAIKLELTYIVLENDSGMEITHSLRLNEYIDPDDTNRIHFEGKNIGTISYEKYVKGITVLDGPLTTKYMDGNLYVTHPDQVVQAWNKIMDQAKKYENIEPVEFYPSISVRGLDYFAGMAPVVPIGNGCILLGKPVPSLGSAYHSHVTSSQQLRDSGLEIYLKDGGG